MIPFDVSSKYGLTIVDLYKESTKGTPYFKFIKKCFSHNNSFFTTNFHWRSFRMARKLHKIMENIEDMKQKT